MSNILEDVILDKEGKEIALVRLIKKGNSYVGLYKPVDVPQELDHLLKLYEEYVNDQVLSLLDNIDEQISLYGLRLQGDGSRIDTIRVVEHEVYLTLK